MKNYLINLSIVSILLLGSQAGYSQGHKVAYTNFNYLYDQMPEKPFIEMVLKSIKAEHDSLLNGKVAVFQEKYKKYEELSKSKANEVVLRDMERELQGLQKNAQEFQASSDNAIVEKERTLAGPIKSKILKAIQDVAKERGFHYVLNSYLEEINLAVLLSAPESANITVEVLKKLGIEPEPEKPAEPEKK